jgi:hypothetical protein
MVETPSYEIIGKINDIEIRRYSKLILATVSGDSLNSPFRILFDYISGDNLGDSKISMTAPVITPETIEMTAPVISVEDSMSFILPSKYTIENTPKPLDERIVINEVPERKIAVLRFRGWARKKGVESQKNRLISILKVNNVKTVGYPFLMRYNSPWTPGLMRRNEIGIEIIE